MYVCGMFSTLWVLLVNLYVTEQLKNAARFNRFEILLDFIVRIVYLYYINIYVVLKNDDSSDLKISIYIIIN